jgi:hypothetical protein
MANENHTAANAPRPGDGFGAKMNDKSLVLIIIFLLRWLLSTKWNQRIIGIGDPSRVKE